MLKDQTDYENAVDLDSLETFNVHKDNEELQSKVFYRVHINNIHLKTVDQKTHFSWL